MSVIGKLACSINRRDEVPNQELARDILTKKDKRAVKELVENLGNKNKNISSDCIKVLYEIGEREPKLIAPYYREFAALLDSKHNRLVWGAMIALDAIAAHDPGSVYGMLAKIMNTADTGSVITRDHTVGILAKLGRSKQYADKCVPLLLDQLRSCPNNQFAMYAEKSAEVVNDKNRAAFQKVMTQRMGTLEKESQQKRVAKVLKRIR